MDTIANEPVITAAVVTVVTWIGARWAIDAQTANALAVIVLAAATVVARRFSIPTATAVTKTEANQKITVAYHADPSRDAKPIL